ncbi:hypothetical protein FB45DRAFT_891853 [Roridomyces roridus]|uniref:Uncharacterized protein n=1 Tax=Roridomyces roridus TaxID=1738132 RepID=A0AAD7CE77_9AGAR|nr:hypothetical protein FB45DRAFT_914259 [Roridomyces roridus]KAJ7646582.1 hypothetical protein FB45DRAFT_890823 [Roridomyces roridus]KAJ7646934.1 hypothetical protein FB45DRAFT_891853 [Roridomyces roridus]
MARSWRIKIAHVWRPSKTVLLLPHPLFSALVSTREALEPMQKADASGIRLALDQTAGQGSRHCTYLLALLVGSTGYAATPSTMSLEHGLPALRVAEARSFKIMSTFDSGVGAICGNLAPPDVYFGCRLLVPVRADPLPTVHSTPIYIIVRIAVWASASATSVDSARRTSIACASRVGPPHQYAYSPALACGCASPITKMMMRGRGCGQWKAVGTVAGQFTTSWPR